MFILSSVSSSLDFWSVNNTSLYENSESKFFKKISVLGEVSSNWPSDWLGTNVCKTLKSYW